MLGIGIPLILRLKSGRIPRNPGDGLPEDILRSTSPRQFCLYNAILLLVLLCLIALTVAIWRAGPAEPGGGGVLDRAVEQ